jgi:hypothetical protein
MVMHLLKISIHCFIVDYASIGFQIQNKIRYTLDITIITWNFQVICGKIEPKSHEELFP